MSTDLNIRTGFQSQQSIRDALRVLIEFVESQFPIQASAVEISESVGFEVETATNVDAALKYLKGGFHDAHNGEMIELYDVDDNFTSDTVEGALAELAGRVADLEAAG